MSRKMRSHELHVPTWFSASPLQPYVAGLVRYIQESGYSKSTLHVYRNAVAHFAHWMTDHKVSLNSIDELLTQRFLLEHLPACRCGPLRQRWPYSVRAALDRKSVV